MKRAGASQCCRTCVTGKEVLGSTTMASIKATLPDELPVITLVAG